MVTDRMLEYTAMLMKGWMSIFCRKVSRIGFFLSTKDKLVYNSNAFVERTNKKLNSICISIIGALLTVFAVEFPQNLFGAACMTV
jgi:hypothetical protein